jgi:hypothetical protein
VPLGRSRRYNDKNEFDQLERELREALATRAAPDGFSRKVMARGMASSMAMSSGSMSSW